MNNIAKLCEFIINEGIMPTIVVRKLTIQEREDIHLLSGILYTKLNSKNYDIKMFPVELQQAAADIYEAFKNDTELYKWLNDSELLFNTIYIFSSLENIAKFSSSLYGLCVDFISSCPFVTEDIKKRYLSLKDNRPLLQTRVNHYSSEEKQKYTDYLINGGYSINTVNSYRSAINKISEEEEIKSLLSDVPLWDITDAAIIRKTIETLETNPFLYPNYWKKSKKSNATWHNALKKYCQFLEVNNIM